MPTGLENSMFVAGQCRKGAENGEAKPPDCTGKLDPPLVRHRRSVVPQMRSDVARMVAVGH